MRPFLTILLLAGAFAAAAQTKIVNNSKELKAAVANAKPGDKIILASGEWKDANLVLSGTGTAQKPVRISAQSPGSVILSGNSSLKLSGEHLIIKDLYFKNGYAAKGDVIEFRTSNDKLANNCRLTGIVIENYSKPEKFTSDHWLVLFGKNNRVDHCTFVDKLNLGTTVIVELTDERSQQNYHSIDSNYFKGRQRLGSNGGETIRVGVSKYSLTPSRTNIKYNYFERCNGEVEVVSVKSGENQISFNTFFECEGSLVLRHGSNNVVEGNLFLGNNKPFTGGIRVINPGHKVFNNVLIDLKGDDFRSALAVMNGVPNSVINRYHQVKDADIHHNTFVNSKSIEFGAGKDTERTAAPENVQFRNNLIAGPSEPLYTDHNQSGISFTANAVVNAKQQTLPPGFKNVKATNKSFKGIEIPKPVSGAGADPSKLPLIKVQATGASWYKPTAKTVSRKGKRIKVPAAEAGRLEHLISNADAGDTIVLTETDIYPLQTELFISKPITIIAAEGLKEKPVLVNVSDKILRSFICIENGGALLVKGIALNGSYQNYADVQAGITTSTKPMILHYKLAVDNCEFYNFNESSFSAFKASKGTYADSLTIKNSVFRNISGTALDLSSEKDDKGIYNAEVTTIENCLFTGILGSALNLYRGGNDESTTGPLLNINHCTFNEVDNREQGSVLSLLGVQQASITNCIFNKSGQGGRSVYFQESGKDDLMVDFCNLYQSGKIESFYNRVTGNHIYNTEPKFKDPDRFDFSLQKDSQLLNKSSEGRALGFNL
ncbi:chondroitinase-B domain-containing protein [Desertivirga xinjiangensis]|uniref:chondroitinase-B domain-containing protein n=1 Tax=Desertivirga xinjiangensis TaxID=539206 RepID=UPI00210EA8BF|nr:chondroitinase-B domain-containing protein [Pedobacter xinjiangensis]